MTGQSLIKQPNRHESCQCELQRALGDLSFTARIGKKTPLGKLLAAEVRRSFAHAPTDVLSENAAQQMTCQEQA